MRRTISIFQLIFYVFITASGLLVQSLKFKNWSALTKLEAKLDLNGGASEDKKDGDVSFIESLLAVGEFSNTGHLYGYGIENHKPSILQNITAQRRLDVLEAKHVLSEDELWNEVAKFEDKYGKPLNLAERIRQAGTEMAIAAEFKRASPSKGDINTKLVAAEQGVAYATSGACVVSVLTEPTWFKGTLQDMLDVRKATQGLFGERRPAVLRKDFIIDPYQILEARMYGADTVLLIVAILEVTTLYELLAFSRSLGMEPLVEVNTPEEMAIALEVGAKVIGVNNRNLHTFELDPFTTEKCAAAAAMKGVGWGPDGEIVLCSLSGISSAKDVERYQEVGVSLVLVGETLMRAEDPKRAIRELLGKTPRPQTFSSPTKESVAVTRVGFPPPIVKICGITNVEDALYAAQSGANLIGVIFAESKRKVAVENAKEVAGAIRKFGERKERIEFSLGMQNVQGLRVEEWYSRWAEEISQKSKRTPLLVGVFQDQPIEQVNALVEEVGLDLVQFHGDETEEDILKCIAPVIKVIHISPGKKSPAEKANDVLANLRAGPSVGLLLDTYVGTKAGGTGQMFDWGVARAIQGLGVPVLVAGGLKPNNVADIRTSTRPWGVDVSSGVESAIGMKDHGAITAFIDLAQKQTKLTDYDSS